MNSLNNKKLILVLSFFVFFAFAGKINAATLFITPPQAEVSVDNIINIQVYVDTAGKVINNAESIIKFPKDLLEVVSLDNRSSVFSIWVEQPSFANSIGQVTFNGGVPNPGFNGGNGNIISIIFKAKKAGTASIIFSNSAVRENDGFGTDIFSGQRGATVSIVNREVVPIVKPSADNISEVSIIRSETHPDQAKWYKDNSPEFSWDLPEGALEVRTSITTAPNSTPTIRYAPAISNKKVDSLDDGTYYFNLQIRTSSGWGTIAHYRVNIDKTPPKPFSITFPHGAKGFSPQPIILFNAVDSQSGVSQYDVKIGKNIGLLTISPVAISNPYLLPPQLPGTHTVSVTAIDRAGNTTNATADFTIEGIAVPIITSYPEKIKSGDLIKIQGTTYPDSDVTILFKQNKDIISEEHTRSNSSGDFSFIVSKNLEKGTYSFTARVTDGRGAKSVETEPLMISVSPEFTNDFTAFIFNYLSVAILAVLIIGAIIGIGIYIWHHLIIFTRHLSKERNQAEQVLQKSFKILRGDITKHINRLKKASAERELTKEEIIFLEKFADDLTEAEDIIAKEIRED